MTSGASPGRIQAFITGWEVSGGAERGNAQTFLNALCDILEVPQPDKPDELPAQAAALSAVLGALAAPADVSTIVGYFKGKKTKKRLEEVTRLLETLEALGRAVERDGGWGAAS